MEALIFFWILTGIAVFFYMKSKAKKDKADELAFTTAKPSLHCMDCGEDFKPPLKGALRGSTVIEVVLWLCYIVPGVIYSIWRRSGSFKSECPMCHSSKVVPIGSRAALAHIKSLS